MNFGALLMSGDAGEERRILATMAKRLPLHPPPEL
jgi:hypothetical protein